MRFKIRLALSVAASAANFLIFIALEYIGTNLRGQPFTLVGITNHVFNTIITWAMFPYLMVSWLLIFLGLSYLVRR